MQSGCSREFLGPAVISIFDESNIRQTFEKAYNIRHFYVREREPLNKRTFEDIFCPVARQRARFYVSTSSRIEFENRPEAIYASIMHVRSC